MAAKRLLLASLLILCCLQGCAKQEKDSKGSTWEDVCGKTGKEQDGESAALLDSAYAAAGCTDLMRSKAEQWRQSSSSGKIENGVWVYSAMITKYAAAPEKLAARVFCLGFSDVYFSAGKANIQDAAPWVRQFNAACHSYGLKVFALRISDNSTFATPSKAEDDVTLVSTYNKGVAASERFDGISADLEAHTVKGTNKPSGIELEWDSTSGYGVGKSNDLLLKLTLEILARVAKKASAASLPLLETVWYNYQINFDSGNLSYGSISQFLESCEAVSVMAYISSKESIWEKSLPSLKNASKEGSVSIAVKTAVNSSDSSSLQPKGWSYLLETMKYLVERSLSYKSFRGIDIFNYKGLEEMWEAEN